MKHYLAGLDIGGTKCAALIGEADEGQISVTHKIRFATPPTPREAISRFITALAEFEQQLAPQRFEAIGISCGGPLDSRAGLILSPPNLPGWDRIDVFTPFRDRFHVPVLLQNDANACALAEWRWGAGKGTQNMVFLTFGTGMGAGLVLDGRLYSGTNDMAGEVGHMRLEADGPVGYGKAGSFEGFCSGGGIAQLAQQMTETHLRAGGSCSFCADFTEIPQLTAQIVGEALQQGDPLAAAIYTRVGRKLGAGLSILIDILNPEAIVIGSIYARQQAFLEPIVLEVLREEALPHSLSVCDIRPAALGEAVGDYASLSVAMSAIQPN
ncbi:MAG: ROK family protein [Anaerolineaceae bacterium]|nr:ROK family protein [Anaerolineaceae bacterium]